VTGVSYATFLLPCVLVSRIGIILLSARNQLQFVALMVSFRKVKGREGLSLAIPANKYAAVAFGKNRENFRRLVQKRDKIMKNHQLDLLADTV